MTLSGDLSGTLSGSGGGIPTDYPDLLPPNKTKLESAIAGPTGRIDHDIPVPIDKLLNAWEIPAGYLPWLAWHLSLDLWDWRWDEFKKRTVIAMAIKLARSKGTAHGMRLHNQVMDTEVTQLIVPPQGIFARPIITKAEYDEWLRTMPQIRIHLARETGSGVGLTFVKKLDERIEFPENDIDFMGKLWSYDGTDWSEMSGAAESETNGEAFDTDGYTDKGFMRFDAGRALYGRAARLWDNGVETPLYLWDVSTEADIKAGERIERVSVPGHADAGAFIGRFADHYYLDRVKKAASLVTFRQPVGYSHEASALSMTSAIPGLEPVDVRSERFSLQGHGNQHAFIGRFLHEPPALSGSTTKQIFLAEDMAPWLLYDRVVLHDPSRATPKVQAWSFLNYSRLGIRDYTAKAVIDLHDKMHRSAFAAGRFLTLGFYLLPDDKTKLNRARLATRVSKAARDRILTTHKLTRPQNFGDGIPLSGATSLTNPKRVHFRL